MKSVAGIFSYSKTKGLFAGVSLEGSAIVERRDANEKLYGSRYTAQQLLTGSVRPPPQAAPLMNILNSRVFSGMRHGSYDDGMYNDIPVYDDHHDDVVWNGQRGSALGEGVPRTHNGRDDYDDDNRPNYGGATKPKRSSTWQDDIYDPPPGYSSPSRTNTYAAGNRASTGGGSDYVYRDSVASPTGTSEKKPPPPKPNFASKAALLKKNEAVALYTFEPDQPGDLGFKKGEIITVLKKTDSDNDWWYVHVQAATSETSLTR